jgi:hypothetical protein
MTNDLAAECSVTAPVWTVTRRRECVQPIPGKVLRRETREGWPLLTVETEANGDLSSTNERGPSLVWFFGLSCRYKRFLCCSSQSSKNSFLLASNFFTLCVPIAQQAGQAVVLGRLSLFMVLRLNLRHTVCLCITTSYWST